MKDCLMKTQPAKSLPAGHREIILTAFLFAGACTVFCIAMLF